ncbi:hypothetical protein KEM60_02869 [Austwickia sp. TVS 96-490-7B]|nr:hypothetical protein [Austwickia sp. TVS 96-490-7B]
MLLNEIADFMVNPQHSVVFSTQLASDEERIADRLIVLCDGRITVDTLLPDIIDSFRAVRGGYDDLPAGAGGCTVVLVAWDVAHDLMPVHTAIAIVTGCMGVVVIVQSLLMVLLTGLVHQHHVLAGVIGVVMGTMFNPVIRFLQSLGLSVPLVQAEGVAPATYGADSTVGMSLAAVTLITAVALLIASYFLGVKLYERQDH